MSKSVTPTFMCELSLVLSSAAERVMNVRFDVARQTYNACLSEALRRLDLLRESKAYQAACKLPRGASGSSAAKIRTAAFRQADKRWGFREYDLHRWATEHIKHEWLGEHLDSHTVQKLATRAFRAAQQYAFGKRGRPRFKGRQQLDSLEGKSNVTGIRWRDDHVEWSGLNLPAVIDANDAVIAHGLAARVKYVRLVRRKLNSTPRYFAQLVCEGQPYQKERNTLGQGVVGLDLGPSTIAVVAPEAKVAFLEVFCSELRSNQQAIRRLQRKLDRQRRANNPGHYNPNGTIRREVKGWHQSVRQRRTGAQLAEMHRRQVAYRKSLHGHLVNRILRLGYIVRLEKISYRAFQRNFGKSIAFRAPGTFVSILKRKAESAGAQVDEFSTRTTRLSQVCHGCGAIARKPLAQRWHCCACGVTAQRDLYAAFLASCVEGERLNAGRARAAWPGVDTLLQAALSRIEQPASGGRLPTSFGLRVGMGRSQSWSPVIAGVNVAEAQDVVPLVRRSDEAGELERGSGTSRTHTY
jgi:putative transposase